MSSPFGEARGQLREEGSARRRSQAGRVGTSHPSAGSTSISGRLVSRAVLPAVECRTTGNVTGELSRRETVGARSWPGRCASTRWSSRCGWCSTHGTSSTANETWQRQAEKKNSIRTWICWYQYFHSKLFQNIIFKVPWPYTICFGSFHQLRETRRQEREKSTNAWTMFFINLERSLTPAKQIPSTTLRAHRQNVIATRLMYDSLPFPSICQPPISVFWRKKEMKRLKRRDNEQLNTDKCEIKQETQQERQGGRSHKANVS